MIKGIGVDIVDLNRFTNKITNEQFINRILSQTEIKKFKQLNSDKRKIEFLAGRFAAKEAYLKAQGTGIGQQPLNTITIDNDNLGKPILINHPKVNEKVFISISHSNSSAVAQALIDIITTP